MRVRHVMHALSVSCGVFCDFFPAGPQPFSSFVAALCFFFLFSRLFSFCTGEHNGWFNIIFQSLEAAGQGLLTGLFHSI